MNVGVSRHADMSRRNSGASRDSSLTLRPSNSNATALVPMSRRSSTQDTALALQQPSQAMVVGSRSLGLIPSSSAVELALLEEADVPRAEHQLRQKVLHASLFDCMALCNVAMHVRPHMQLSCRRAE